MKVVEHRYRSMKNISMAVSQNFHGCVGGSYKEEGIAQTSISVAKITYNIALNIVD